MRIRWGRVVALEKADARGAGVKRARAALRIASIVALA